jgi:tRNA isopentenyl-2-thiomethyl-A-37 hydroxylase MiaE
LVAGFFFEVIFVANFTSRFAELGFYCCDELHKFYNGEYKTEKECEIKALEKLADVVRVDQPKQAEESPKAKAPAKKSSGK